MNKAVLYGATDSSGDAVLTDRYIHGVIYAVQWIDGDLADGVGAVLSVTGPYGVITTILTLTNANDDAIYYPRVATHDNTGAAQTTLEMPICHGVPTLTISNGGDTKTGGCIVSFFRAED